MKSNRMRCRMCGRKMSLCRLDPVEGDVHGLHVQIEGLPVLECPRGHRRLLAPDFAPKLMEALSKDERFVSLSPASRGGPRRERYACPGCGKALEGGANSHAEAKRVLELNGHYAFGVWVGVPKFHCPTCDRESVPPDEVIIDDLLQTSVVALRSASVSPL